VLGEDLDEVVAGVALPGCVESVLGRHEFGCETADLPAFGEDRQIDRANEPSVLPGLTSGSFAGSQT
jgi:hypothetical protein